MSYDEGFYAGRDFEREQITKLFQKRQDLKDKLKELEDQYRHHNTALTKKEMFKTQYKYGLNSSSPYMNQVYAEKFVELYTEKKSTIVNKLEDINSELFDITGGRF